MIERGGGRRLRGRYGGLGTWAPRSAEGRIFSISEVTVRYARALCGIAVVAALAGCSDDKPAATSPAFVTPASAPAWSEPADYAFVVDRQCEGQPSLGKYRVTVTGREVAGVERIDGRTASGEEEIEVPTLGGLLELAQTAADDGGAMTVRADPADGHPVLVSFDVSDGSETAPAATCFVISEYAPRS
jgi:hypothetical protein